MAAFTRSGARKAREIVMLTFRMLHRSRFAMLSAFAFASARSSSSQRRPRAIDATRSARDSERIGRACCGRIPVGRRMVRLVALVLLSLRAPQSIGAVAAGTDALHHHPVGFG